MGLFGPRQPSEHYTRSRHYQLVNPDMPLTTTTDYEKIVDPKQPGSWDARYVPPRKEIIRRVVDRHTNVGAQGFGTLGGATGAVIGGLAGGMLSKSRYGAPAGAVVGGLVGGIPSAIAGGRWGNKRGKRIAKEIPQEPGNVSDFKANHPILSRLYFAKRRGLKKHRAIPYNRAYNAKDISAYNTEIGPMVNVGRSRVVHDKAPIKTGFSKLGYYRENDMTRDELIEAILEAAPKVNFLSPRGLYTTVGAAARDSKRLGKVTKFIDQLDYFGDSPQTMQNIKQRARQEFAPPAHIQNAWKQIPLTYKVKRLRDFVRPGVQKKSVEYATQRAFKLL